MIGTNEKRSITAEDADTLREAVRPYYTDKRYSHTLAVEREAAALGEIYMPERVAELRISALLHDITKRADIKKQLQYCSEFGIIVEAGDEISPAVLHARTGAALAARNFSELVNTDILAGIRWHTTGRDGMSLFESIIYLADYIEDTRTFDDCVKLRESFYSRLGAGEDKLTVLCDTMISSFDMTVSGLIRDGAVIDSDTVCARNYFVVSKKDMSKLFDR